MLHLELMVFMLQILLLRSNEVVVHMVVSEIIHYPTEFKSM